MSESAVVLCQKCRRSPEDPEHLLFCDCDCSLPLADGAVVLELRIEAVSPSDVIEQLRHVTKDLMRGDLRGQTSVGISGTSRFSLEWKDSPGV